jgi:NADPH:quinone reductase-like Zn-dependent oxidoreductase
MSQQQIPSSCKALQLEKAQDKSNGRNVAAIRTVDVPGKPSEGMVLIKMLAAGFNRRDEWGMMGMYPGLIYKNSTFGCDGVGVIAAGRRSTEEKDSLPEHKDGLVVLVPTRGWTSDEEGPEAAVPGAPTSVLKNKLGGTGFGLLGCTKQTNGVGTFCEYMQVEDDMFVNVPGHLNAVQAAALPCGGVTAYRALFTKAKLKRGQTLLITGIGGGVALLALQMAVAAGVKVFVTGGTAEKVQRAEKMGAKGGVVYREESWPKQLAKLVQERSKDRPYIDAIVDSAGGNVPAQAATAGLRVGGRIVCFGMTAEPKMTFTMREVLRNVDIAGSTMGSKQEFKRMIAFIDQHKIVPVIDTVLQGLDQAHRGFPLLQDADKRSGGKVIVEIASNKSTTAQSKL